jgi:hypothetical protein
MVLVAVFAVLGGIARDREGRYRRLFAAALVGGLAGAAVNKWVIDWFVRDDGGPDREG